MCPGVRIIYSPRISYMCLYETISKKKPKSRKKKFYKYKKSKITTERKELQTKIWEACCNSVYIPFCFVAVSLRLFDMLFSFFLPIIFGRLFMPARMMPVQSSCYTGIYGAGGMFGYYVTQKWDKHISIWIEILN